MLILFSCILLPCINGPGQTPANDLNWQAYFFDDFTGPLNTSFWKIPSGNWQPKRENWTFDGVKTENGILELPISEILPIPEGGERKFNVSGLENRTFTYPYGFYEVRCQFPVPIGRWLTFWIIDGTVAHPSTDSSWEELDFVELHMTNEHQWTSGFHSTPTIDNMAFVGMPLPNTIMDFNTYGIEWTPKCYILYFNGIPIKEVFYNTRVPKLRQLTLRVTPGMSDWGPPVDMTKETTTKIDYIKIWTLKKDLTAVTISNNSDVSSFVYNIKQSIFFDARINNITIPIGLDLCFRAIESISVEGDFTVPTGAGLTLFPHSEPNN